MNETRLSGESFDIVSDNISKLKELFPEVITEDKIDFEKLKLVLGEDIETESERYNFTWPGKTQAIKEAQKQSTGTLRPCKEESKNWDTTKNLYIEGDNLEVLKLLQKGYHNKVKMIYIDPPYNTGKDFVYKDNYKDNLENYLELTSQINDGNKLSTNMESDGRFHSNWLNMLYPRLKLSRNLLKEDGILLVSIGEDEIDNLKKILFEIYGETNFITQFIWQSKSGGSHDEKFIVNEVEYILIFAKNKNKLVLSKNEIEDPSYNLEDKFVKERGKYKLKKLDYRMTSSHYTESLNYPIELPDGGKLYPGGDNKRSDEGWNWRWSKSKVDWGLKNNFIVIKKNNKGNWAVYTKQYEKVDNNNNPISRAIPYRNLIFSKDFNTIQATNEINKFFGYKIFEYAKPSNLIEYFLNICNPEDDLILDFFSGSATTANALFNWNLNNNRKNSFILIQIPESLEKNSKGYQEGYKNICEIGKERIRRAGDKIIGELGNNDIDIGFKVFKLDSSNLEKWNPNYDNLEQTLLISQDNIKNGRTQEDLIYEIMLKYGIDLTLPIEEYVAGENKIYSIGFGALLICLDNKITKDITDSIIELASEDISRVVFKDNGFASDADKTNIKETLRTHNIDEFITI